MGLCRGAVVHSGRGPFTVLACAERTAAELMAAPPEEELRTKRAEADFGAALCGLTILRCARRLAPYSGPASRMPGRKSKRGRAFTETLSMCRSRRVAAQLPPAWIVQGCLVAGALCASSIAGRRCHHLS